MSKRWRALGLFYLLIGSANLVRAILAFVMPPALRGWHLALPLPLLGGIYLVWGSGFVGAGIFFRRHSGATLARLLAWAYQGTVWLINLLGYRSTYARTLRARDLLLTVLFLGLVGFLSQGAGLQQPHCAKTASDKKHGGETHDP